MTREEAIKILTETQVFYFAQYGKEKTQEALDMAIEALKAEPVKHGEWIMHIDDLFPEESTMECNQCHEHQPLTIDDNFCPNCGAKMDK